MISKQKIEFIRSLANKKEREKAGCFVAEGEKLVFDLLKTKLVPMAIYATSKGLATCEMQSVVYNTILLSDKEMERISAFKNPSSILALFKIPVIDEGHKFSFEGISLVLDGIQDPGNMGTIVRMADWFGISTLFCSPECVDLYNPKCVQSTMGALARVKVHYLDLQEVLSKALESKTPVYGTFMDGESIFQTDLESNALVVLGSEGQGISAKFFPYLTKRISIPSFPPGNKELESLNVALSASIVCAEIRRRSL